MVVNSSTSTDQSCNPNGQHGALTGTELTRLLADVANVRVSVVGDFCLDAYWHLDEASTERSVETGLEILRVSEQRYTLGGAGNVLANLVDLGVRDVKAIGVLGSDPFGRALLELLQRYGADTAAMQDLGGEWQTGVYAKPYVGATEQRRLDFGTRASLPELAVARLIEDLHQAAEWSDAVVINQQVESCFAQPAITAKVNAVIAAHPDTLFVVDARDASAHYTGAVLKVNSREARIASGDGAAATSSLSEEETTELAVRLARKTRLPVFVTRGERGIVAADAEGTYVARGIDVRTQTDPVGAGDTVVAAVAAILAAGGSVAGAVFLANIAASVTVAKVHTTGTVTPDELVAAAESADYVYAPELADNPARARYLEGTEIELIAALPRSAPPSHVIFDFDGTISTLRQGWEEVMEPMMIEAIFGDHYGSVDADTYQRVRAAVGDFIDRTTGIQTLVQMQGLAELVRRSGYVPEAQILDEHGYKATYNDALMKLVGRRRAKLESGQLSREDFMMKNGRELIEALIVAGVQLFIASGTDVGDVAAEAEALGVADYFEGRIYGSVGDVRVEAKKVVIERILREARIDPAGLVTFGDGPVEMRETRGMGGFAVGVCSDERQRHGYNLAKRPRLIRGGANILIPDFSDLGSLLRILGLSR
jgi:rfaE bifunctional protein kinase chain/domain